MNLSLRLHPAATALAALLTFTACTDKPPLPAQSVTPETFFGLRTAGAPEGSAAEPGRLPMDVLRWGQLDETVEVRVDTVDIGSAREDRDFQPLRDTRIVFAPGERVRTVEVPLIGNDVAEANRSLALQLQIAPDPRNRVETPVALGVIADDDSSCLLPPAANPWLERSPIGFAHRGGVREFPENTLYAYDQAARLGLDVLEMDVYPTADGEIVVIHDASVDRTTNGSGNVSALTLAELRALDAAHWFVPGRGATRDAAPEEYVFRGIAGGAVPPPPGYRARDFRIPTLEEALQAFPDRWLNIELKPSPQATGDYEARVAELLLQYGRLSDAIVASFSDASLSLLQSAAPCLATAVPTGQVAAAVATGLGPLSGVPLAPLHQVFQVPRAFAGVEVVTADFVADARANGLAVHVFTIDSCAEMLELLELGVDGIMTDRPSVLAALLAQPAETRNCRGLE